jgi:hypothetical protein
MGPNQYGNYCYAISNPVENFEGINGIVITTNGPCIYSNVKLGSLGKEFTVKANPVKNAKGTFLNLPNAQGETIGDMKHIMAQAKFIGIDSAVAPLMASELMKLLKVKAIVPVIEEVLDKKEESSLDVKPATDGADTGVEPDAKPLEEVLENEEKES